MPRTLAPAVLLCLVAFLATFGSGVVSLELPPVLAANETASPTASSSPSNATVSPSPSASPSAPASNATVSPSPSSAPNATASPSPAPSPKLQCANYTSCGNCTEQWDCVWCDSDSTCEDGNVWGPNQNPFNSCPDWRWRQCKGTVILPSSSSSSSRPSCLRRHSGEDVAAVVVRMCGVHAHLLTALTNSKR